MRLLFADDHQLFADAIMALFKSQRPEVEIDHALDFDAALSLASSGQHYDGVVLDLRMPGMGGVDGVRRFLAVFCGVPLILMSGAATFGEVNDALTLGAAGFLSKSLTGQEFVGRLDAMLMGERQIPASAAFDYTLGGGRKLTEREMEIIALLGAGLSNKEIGLKLNIASSTVKVHVKAIMTKFGVRNRTEVAIAVLKNSFV
jgi:two-component system, NarL family, nitrate/nitrite response regulator NarL